MYISTRGNYNTVSSSEAIKLGMVPSGGLFVPYKLPLFPLKQLLSMQGCSYQELALYLFDLFLEDYPAEEISSCVYKAYNQYNFHHRDIVPLQRLRSGGYIMELWHGPTAAFKDIALQIMPLFLSHALQRLEVEREMVILVATSGDTGKAALEGFKNVPGTKIIVFYPCGGVSKLQELQMLTTDGPNTFVVGIEGNFDDCQSAVKEIFGDCSYNKELASIGYELSSANSINWGRLLPQIVYYFWAYLSLFEKGQIAAGEKINFVVPTGNFGNILAGWYAWSMGLPVNRLLCASNSNNVLTDFFGSGFYDRNRGFIKTRSPSMDILISSNLERFLFEAAARDAEKISSWMIDLQKKGCFQVDGKTLANMQNYIYADFADEADTLETIRETYFSEGYPLDPHSAVGMNVYKKYRHLTGDETKTVIAATASPFKFGESVLEALKGREFLAGKDEFQLLEELGRVINLTIHPGLKDLDKKSVLHQNVSTKMEIKEQLERILNGDV